MSAPQHPASNQPGDDPQPPEALRRSPSVLGLSIVSGLNIISLAFIAFHYSNHAQVPEAAPAPNSPAEGGLSVANESGPEERPVSTTEGVIGNVNLMPSSRPILEIASASFEDDDKQTEDQTSDRISQPQVAESLEKMDERAEYWVQIGALSNEGTAKQYWKTLKTRHATLLRDHRPRYFGPADVGGHLHHIRLGPMSGDAAADLCKRLQIDGGDCFCIGPPGKKS